MLSQKMQGQPLIYLDSAATAQKPKSVIDAMTDFYTHHYSTVHRAVYQLSQEATKQYHEARVSVAKFLGAAKSHEIIFTRGTTESINMIAYSFGKAFMKQGDEVLITEMEHHSNIVPWQIMCEDRAAILKVIPVSEKGEINLADLEKAITNKTKIVSVTQISNLFGTINDIKQIAHIVHAKGAKLLVDGAQSAPSISVNVQDLDVDFFVFSGHKIYGPTGIGVLYGKEELLNLLPPYQGGGDMIETVTFEKTTYNTLPMKFEAGTPMIVEVIGLGAAIKYLTQIGMKNIESLQRKLLEYAEERMREIEFLRIIGQAEHKKGIISFIVEGVHPLDIGTMLDLKGIAIRTGHLCVQPALRKLGLTAVARASFGLYNSIDEIDLFISSLKDVIKILK